MSAGLEWFMPRFTVLETSALFSNRVKYDYLFEMEMWLKGLERFFQIDCLPRSAFERSHASLKNYVEEVGAARAGVAHLAMLTTQLLGEGKEDLASFLVYLDSQVARTGSGEVTARRRGNAETELALVVEKLDDSRRSSTSSHARRSSRSRRISRSAGSWSARSARTPISASSSARTCGQSSTRSRSSRSVGCSRACPNLRTGGRSRRSSSRSSRGCATRTGRAPPPSRPPRARARFWSSASSRVRANPSPRSSRSASRRASRKGRPRPPGCDES